MKNKISAASLSGKMIHCTNIQTTGTDLIDNTAFEKERSILVKNLHDVLYDPQAQAPLEHFQSDGTWSDLDYDDHSHGSNWSPLKHLIRMKALASARPELAVKALEAWLNKAPSSQNWWWGCIGIPQFLGKTLLTTGPQNVPDSLLKKAEPIIRKASLNNMTGQNLVWVEEIRIYTGLLYNQPELVQEGHSVILNELKIVSPGEEGLQSDFSYHQHGIQNQVGNYGLSFLQEQIQWAHVFMGTLFAYTKEEIQLIDLYFMNSMRWTLSDGIMDYSFSSRQIWDGVPEVKYKTIIQCGKNLLPLVPAKRQAEYRKWLKNPESLTGAVAFPNSACLIYRAPNGWRFSLKMSSSKIIGSETVNMENTQGLYQGDGVSFFGNMKRYGGFPALYNQRMLPGTTEPQNRISLRCPKKTRNTNGYFAVLANYPFAIAALRMDAKDVQADKVWFCTPSGITCAGSAINSTSASPVVTTVDQFRADSEADFPIEVSGDGIKRKVEKRKGNWKDSFSEFPSKVITGEVITLMIDHGIKPDNAGYWYSLKKKGIPAQKEIRLNTSSSRIHALLSGDCVLTAAFENGKVTLPCGKQIRVFPGATIWSKNGTRIKREMFSFQ